MDIVRCEKGHFYDASENPTCPQCAAEANGTAVSLEQVPPTTPVGFDSAGIDPVPPTVPVGGGRNGETIPVQNNGFTPDDFMLDANFIPDSGMYPGPSPFDPVPPTMPVAENGVFGFRPVTGWLVCVEGPNKGTDYRVVNGNNFIGRSQSSNICILNDAAVSYERHASLTYDTKNHKFYFGLNSGSNPVYVNGNIVFSPIEIKAFDEILIGSTKLLFVPFCGENFNWSE